MGVSRAVPRARAAFARGLPPQYSASAGDGHDRVRDGSGWFAAAFAHARHRPGHPHRIVSFSHFSRRSSVLQQDSAWHTAPWRRGPPPRLAPRAGDCEPPSPMRTAPLQRLPAVHARPLNPVVCRGAYSLMGMGGVISRWGSHLDALSGSPIPTWLPGGAALATTGTPAVGPARSSRTRASADHPSIARGG